jgi:hypothetical protein
VLEEAGETWRDLCATAIYLGLRKGELFGLRKQDTGPVHSTSARPCSSSGFVS